MRERLYCPGISSLVLVVSVSTQSPCAGCVVSTVHYLLYTIYRGGLGHSDPRVSRELAHMERGGTLARVTS